MSAGHKGPFSLRLVGMYGETGPLQMNIVCLRCNGMIAGQHPMSIEQWFKWDCPDYIVNIPHTDKGNIDIEALFAALEKRHQL